MNQPRDLVIIGAGGAGRELLQVARDAASHGWGYRVVGFLDDNPHALDGFDGVPPILGPFDDPEFLDSDVSISVGNAEMRRRCALAVDAAGGRLTSVIHPGAYVAPTARIADGVTVAFGAFIGASATIGRNTSINVLASIGHDARVGEHCVLSSYTAVTGAVELGDGVFTGTHTTINPMVSIGAWSKVSSGSVVTRDSASGSLLVGNPAKGRVMFAAPQ